GCRGRIRARNDAMKAAAGRRSNLRSDRMCKHARMFRHSSGHRRTRHASRRLSLCGRRCTPAKTIHGGTMAIASPSVESRETVSLIGSDKVEGTAVYGADQKKIGKLERVMIDKISGKVTYAVLSF